MFVVASSPFFSCTTSRRRAHLSEPCLVFKWRFKIYFFCKRNNNTGCLILLFQCPPRPLGGGAIFRPSYYEYTENYEYVLLRRLTYIYTTAAAVCCSCDRERGRRFCAHYWLIHITFTLCVMYDNSLIFDPATTASATREKSSCFVLLLLLCASAPGLSIKQHDTSPVVYYHIT